MFTAKLILAALASAGMLVVPVSQRFRGDYRATAIEVVQNHLEQHPDCDLKDTVQTLTDMQMFFSMKIPGYKAGAFPRVGALYPTVFINPDLKWTETEAIVTLIHESTHLTRRDGRWLCGDDNWTPATQETLKANPPCRLFGKVQYRSEDITRDIQEHLGLK